VNELSRGPTHFVASNTQCTQYASPCLKIHSSFPTGEERRDCASRLVTSGHFCSASFRVQPIDLPLAMRNVGFLDPRQGPPCVSELKDGMFKANPGECAIDSGYMFWVIRDPPSANQIPAICKSARCASLIAVMRKVAPTECVMFDGFFLYEDILNPVLKQCNNGAPPPPPISAPAPVSTPSPIAGAIPAPTTVGERPVGVVSTVPPTTPALRISTSSPSSDAANTSSSSSSSSPATTFGVIFGCVFGVVLLVACFLWIRQQRKRDPDVQREQRLEYGPEGAFDTMIEPTPYLVPYQVMEPVEHYQQPRPSSEKSFGSGPGPIPSHIVVSASTQEKSATKSTSNRASLGSDVEQQIPLLHDEQITAVRVPFDKVLIGERISSGGYGEVYKGTYKLETVAVKRMLPEHRSDARQINKFLGEVKLMATLEHEYIVRFIGVAWKSPQDVCVLAEFMEGGDLRTMLRRLNERKKPIGFDRTKLKIALHVAHAITYMHSLQPVVLHRDLKSRNILLSQNMDAKITDFGSSRERADAAMTRGVGTSLWMAPEIMKGERYDEKADMFSFGVVLSELDSNKLPYASQMDRLDERMVSAEIMQSVAKGWLTVDFSYESDPDIVALGRACVAVDPLDRPSAAEALHRVHQVLRHYDGLA
jgi:hypothetical protein